MRLLSVLFSLSVPHAHRCHGFVIDVKGRHGRPITVVSASSSPRHDVDVSARAILSAALLMALPLAATAVSGGGLDFANLDITGQDFSNGNYKGKDFTQGKRVALSLSLTEILCCISLTKTHARNPTHPVIAKGTTFAASNLQGCRFYKAYLARADFSGSDLRGASLEDTSMDDANLKNAVAAGAYFGASILDVYSIENVDFTEAQLPPKILAQLCDRDDAKGTNPVTGADTKESLMCP